MESVKIAVGELPRYFPFPVPGSNVPAYSTAVIQPSLPIPRDNLYETLFIWLTAGTVAPSATVQWQGTDDPVTGIGFTIPCNVSSGSAVITPVVANSFTNIQGPWVNPNILTYAITTGMLIIGFPFTVNPLVTVSAAAANSVTASGNASVSGVYPVLFSNLNWVAIGAGQTTSAGTPPTAAAGLVDSSPYRWIRANVTAFAGTTPAVSCAMSG
jgi:hypothetical protein